VPVGAPLDYRITVTRLRRGFFLRRDYAPGKPLLDWKGSVTLAPSAPEAVLWRAPHATRASGQGDLPSRPASTTR
jgi:hypothetical protein